MPILDRKSDCFLQDGKHPKERVQHNQLATRWMNDLQKNSAIGEHRSGFCFQQVWHSARAVSQILMWATLVFELMPNLKLCYHGHIVPGFIG